MLRNLILTARVFTAAWSGGGSGAHGQPLPSHDSCRTLTVNLRPPPKTGNLTWDSWSRGVARCGQRNPGHSAGGVIQEQKMFCADYVAAFVVHAASSLALLELTSDSPSLRRLVASGVGCTDHQVFTVPAIWGGLSGLVGATAVFPFDFVRQAMAAPQASLAAQYRASLCTVPYCAVFYGLYFSQRRPNDIKSQAPQLVALQVLTFSTGELGGHRCFMRRGRRVTLRSGVGLFAVCCICDGGV